MILAGQSPSGAYVACPNFEVYRFSWLRDGASSPTRCARWARSRAPTASSTGAHARARAPTGPWDARYTLDGERDTSAWPKLQTDGLGLLLWALRRRGTSRWDDAAQHVRSWLDLHWTEPCIDWWEEREGIHASTLWCIGDGLDSDEIRREAIARAEERLDASQLCIGAPELVARIEACSSPRAAVSGATSTTSTTAAASGSC